MKITFSYIAIILKFDKFIGNYSLLYLVQELSQSFEKFDERSHSNKGLVEEGVSEMKALGKRYRERFEDFIPEEFNESIQVL